VVSGHPTAEGSSSSSSSPAIVSITCGTINACRHGVGVLLMGVTKFRVSNQVKPLVEVVDEIKQTERGRSALPPPQKHGECMLLHDTHDVNNFNLFSTVLHRTSGATTTTHSPSSVRHPASNLYPQTIQNIKTIRTDYRLCRCIHNPLQPPSNGSVPSSTLPNDTTSPYLLPSNPRILPPLLPPLPISSSRRFTKLLQSLQSIIGTPYPFLEQFQSQSTTL